MLILSRKQNERIFIDGGRIQITIQQIGRGAVRLGIDAPGGVRIDREEVHKRRLAAIDAAKKSLDWTAQHD